MENTLAMENTNTNPYTLPPLPEVEPELELEPPKSLSDLARLLEARMRDAVAAKRSPSLDPVLLYHLAMEIPEFHQTGAALVPATVLYSAAQYTLQLYHHLRGLDLRLAQETYRADTVKLAHDQLFVEKYRLEQEVARLRALLDKPQPPPQPAAPPQPQAQPPA